MKAQLIAFAWAQQTYGKVVAKTRYQAFRFFEEALELVQAMGLSREDVIRGVDWVYGREKGEMRIEIGDCLLSLDILAASQGLSTDECYHDCLIRISHLDPTTTREKDLRKIEAGLI